MIRVTGNRLQLIIYLLFFLFAFWIVYIIIYGNGGIVKREKIEKELRVLEEEIYGLERTRERLDWEIKNLRSNRSYIEAYAREIGFKKRGEIIFKFVKKSKQE